jgi:hypothetical protein
LAVLCAYVEVISTDNLSALSGMKNVMSAAIFKQLSSFCRRSICPGGKSKTVPILPRSKGIAFA